MKQVQKHTNKRSNVKYKKKTRAIKHISKPIKYIDE